MMPAIAELERLITADAIEFDSACGVQRRRERPPGRHVLDDPLLRWALDDGKSPGPMTEHRNAIMDEYGRIVWYLGTVFTVGDREIRARNVLAIDGVMGRIAWEPVRTVQEAQE